jgi:hypothetical protein
MSQLLNSLIDTARYLGVGALIWACFQTGRWAAKHEIAYAHRGWKVYLAGVLFVVVISPLWGLFVRLYGDEHTTWSQMLTGVLVCGVPSLLGARRAIRDRRSREKLAPHHPRGHLVGEEVRALESGYEGTSGRRPEG